MRASMDERYQATQASLDATVHAVLDQGERSLAKRLKRSERLIALTGLLVMSGMILVPCLGACVGVSISEHPSPKLFVVPVLATALAVWIYRRAWRRVNGFVMPPSATS